ncbi:MAG: hypothetical protein ACO1PI_03350 [Bacteroidota bacterium]
MATCKPLNDGRFLLTAPIVGQTSLCGGSPPLPGINTELAEVGAWNKEGLGEVEIFATGIKPAATDSSQSSINSIGIYSR